MHAPYDNNNTVLLLLFYDMVYDERIESFVCTRVTAHARSL